jgi:hypothetical protein
MVLSLRLIFGFVVFVVICSSNSADTVLADDRLSESIIPILENHCFDCHADGGEEGGVTFDYLLESEDPEAGDPELWNRVLTQLRTGLMPPVDAEQLEPDQIQEIESWILKSAFQHDPENPDPGRVTVRRLNRIEYQNTVRDLVGVKFDATVNFPPDDTGEGFDNVADVLSISPILMEKYIDAAQSIAEEAVPLVGKRIPRQEFYARKFDVGPESIRDGKLSMSYYQSTIAKLNFRVKESQKYRLKFELVLAEDYIENAIDLNRCRVSCFLDDEELFREEHGRDPWKKFNKSFERELESGNHALRFEIEPLTEEKQGRKLQIRIDDLVLEGPLGDKFQEVPKDHAEFFRKPIPESDSDRLAYARELIAPFLVRAFRRPADDRTVDRLCGLAQAVWQGPDGSFEKGIQQAMVAVLASPRFLFREQMVLPEDPQKETLQQHGSIDEFSLASRLSYFLWSTMPDEELLRLAGQNKLRKNMDQQIGRMIQDRKFDSFLKNFVGQWLQTRDVEGVAINTFSVLLRESNDPAVLQAMERREELDEKSDELTPEEKVERSAVWQILKPLYRQSKRMGLNDKLRRAMRRETEMLLEHLIRENRSLLELVDCDYTFLNEQLAKHYGIPDVDGSRMRKVDLPEGSLRGGLLGHGSMLTVTSNPDRTSPVKRGLFLLDNVLGMPTGAAPPDIPSLEESESESRKSGKKATLREVLAIHREDALCSSCHNRMDPLGLALENFDPMGRQRPDRTIDVSGELITGETFETVNELKKILVANHQHAIYRCVAEKTLTYALGRSLEYYDVPTVDGIVKRLENSKGKGSELIRAVVDSVAFQKKRREEPAQLSKN